jgi:hypothetical protein
MAPIFAKSDKQIEYLEDENGGLYEETKDDGNDLSIIEESFVNHNNKSN